LQAKLLKKLDNLLKMNIFDQDYSYAKRLT